MYSIDSPGVPDQNDLNDRVGNALKGFPMLSNIHRVMTGWTPQGAGTPRMVGANQTYGSYNPWISRMTPRPAGVSGSKRLAKNLPNPRAMERANPHASFLRVMNPDGISGYQGPSMMPGPGYQGQLPQRPVFDNTMSRFRR